MLHRLLDGDGLGERRGQRLLQHDRPPRLSSADGQVGLDVGRNGEVDRFRVLEQFAERGERRDAMLRASSCAAAGRPGPHTRELRLGAGGVEWRMHRAGPLSGSDEPDPYRCLWCVHALNLLFTSSAE
jgi:hypothetical protein